MNLITIPASPLYGNVHTKVREALRGATARFRSDERGARWEMPWEVFDRLGPMLPAACIAEAVGAARSAKPPTPKPTAPPPRMEPVAAPRPKLVPVGPLTAGRLAEAVKKAAVVVEAKAPQRILRCVRMEADGKELRLLGTDLKRILEVRVQAEGLMLDALCVEPKPLLAALKGKNGVGVTLTRDNAYLVVAAGGSTVKLPVMKATDFPAVMGLPVEGREWGEFYALSFSDLNGLAWCATAMSEDETRPHLSCVCLSTVQGERPEGLGEGERVLVSTDGHRLHVAPVRCPLPVEAGDVLIPAPVVKGIAKLAHGAVTMQVLGAVDPEEDSTPWLRFTGGDWEMTAMGSDARFPPWAQVVPKVEPEFTVEVLADDLDALPRGKDVKAVALGFDALRMKVEWTTTEYAEGAVEVPLIDVVGTPDADFRIGVSPRYIREAVEGAGTARLAFNAALDPVKVMRDNGRVAVIMPMRI